MEMNDAESTETRFFDLSETPTNMNVISQSALECFRAEMARGAVTK
jgi:hypothetical protein